MYSTVVASAVVEGLSLAVENDLRTIPLRKHCIPDWHLLTGTVHGRTRGNDMCLGLIEIHKWIRRWSGGKGATGITRTGHHQMLLSVRSYDRINLQHPWERPRHATRRDAGVSCTRSIVPGRKIAPDAPFTSISL